MNSFLHFIIPATLLDWLFLILLVSWSAFAVFAARKAKESLDIRIKQSHFKNIRSSAHDLAMASRHPFWDHVVDNAPGFALVLGLLGTFLGIGMAIQDAGSVLADLNSRAADATDIRQTIGSLSPMMSEIGLKFKSSAWGILSHIFLRVVIPYIGLEEKRLTAIFKELEEDYAEEERIKQQRWKKVEEMTELLSGALYIRQAQDGSLVKLLDQQAKTLNGIWEIQQSFGSNVEVLGKSVKTFEKTVDEFREGVRHSLHEMKTSVERSTKGLQDAVQSMKDEVRITFNEFKGDVSATLDNVGKNIAASSQQISQSVDALGTSMQSQLSNVTKVTLDLTTHSREMATAIQEQRHHLSEMGDRVESIASQGAKYGFALEDVTANIANLAGSDGEMVSNLRELVISSKDTQDSTKKANDILGNILLENKKQNGKEKRGLLSIPFTSKDGVDNA